VACFLLRSPLANNFNKKKGKRKEETVSCFSRNFACVRRHTVYRLSKSTPTPSQAGARQQPERGAMQEELNDEDAPARPTCAVCLEAYDVGDKDLTTTPCCHTFHAACYARWASHRLRPTCPLCRTSLAPDASDLAGVMTNADLLSQEGLVITVEESVRNLRAELERFSETLLPRPASDGELLEARVEEVGRAIRSSSLLSAETGARPSPTARPEQVRSTQRGRGASGRRPSLYTQHGGWWLERHAPQRRDEEEAEPERFQSVHTQQLARYLSR
jgi:hypothetical protein